MSKEMRFTTHKEIPIKYRRGILDFSGENRIHKVDIWECNRICDEIDMEQTVNAEQLKFDIHYSSGGRVEIVRCFGYPEAAIAMDRITDFGTCKETTAVMVQNGRPVRGYEKGKFIEDQTSIYAGMGHGMDTVTMYA